MSLVIARSKATKQSIFVRAALDCFAPLAMTVERLRPLGSSLRGAAGDAAIHLCAQRLWIASAQVCNDDTGQIARPPPLAPPLKGEGDRLRNVSSSLRGDAGDAAIHLCARHLHRQHFAGVQDVFGIERALEALHDIQGDRIFHTGQKIALQFANAMFG